MQIALQLVNISHSAASYLTAQMEAKGSEMASWATKYEQAVLPLLEIGGRTPANRKRKAVEELDHAATAVRKARKQFRYAAVDEDETRCDDFEHHSHLYYYPCPPALGVIARVLRTRLQRVRLIHARSVASCANANASNTAPQSRCAHWWNTHFLN